MSQTPFLGFSVSYLGANPPLVFLKAYCVSYILMYDSLVLGGAFLRKWAVIIRLLVRSV